MTREISEHVGNQIWHMKAYFKISAIVYFEVEDTSPITFKQKPLINFLYFCSCLPSDFVLCICGHDSHSLAWYFCDFSLVWANLTFCAFVFF